MTLFHVLVFKVLKIGFVFLFPVQRYSFFSNYAIAKICLITQIASFLVANYAISSRRVLRYR